MLPPHLPTFLPHRPRRAINVVGRLLFGELVVVLQFFLQAIQFLLQIGNQAGLGRIPRQVVQFLRIVNQVVAFPLVLLPEVDELVGLGPTP